MKRCKISRRASRQGVSLVELLFTMSACVVLLSLSATLLQRAMRTQVKSRAATDLQRTLLRFDQTFRHDVHQALAADTESALLEPETVLRLRLPDSEAIEYRRQSTGLERVLLKADGVVSREAFLFPREVQPTITRPQSGLLALSIKADEALAHAPPVHVYVEAVLQRDRAAIRGDKP